MTVRTKAGSAQTSVKKPRLHLQKGEPTGEGLRKIATLQLGAAVTLLKGNNVSPDPIHNARTYIKKVRAILQIAAPAFPRFQRDELLKRLAEASSRIAPLRDSEVNVQTLDDLLGRYHLAADQFSTLRGGLADVARQRRINDTRQIPRVISSLRAVLTSVPEWPLDPLDVKDLRRRIRRTYRRGRRALDRCTDKDDPELFHIWRKLVKQLWYQLRITSPNRSHGSEKLIEATREIGVLAGTERDYTLLAATLSSAQKSKASALLLEKIRDIRPQLRHEALEAGRRFYKQKPKAFAEGLDL